MNASQTIANSLLKDYTSTALRDSRVRIQTRVKSDATESYCLVNERGSLSLEASTPSALISGTEFALAASNACLAESLGRVQPRFKSRPLLFLGCRRYRLGALSLSLPEELDDAEGCCRRLMELGFNSLILGLEAPGPHSQEASTDLSVLESFVKTAAELRLQVYLAPDVAGWEGHITLSEKFQTTVRENVKGLFGLVPCATGLFWQSPLCEPQFSQHSANRDATLYDLVLQELRLVESSLGTHALIYSLESSSDKGRAVAARIVPELCDDAGPFTSLAFPAQIDSSDQLHPLWTGLRSMSQASLTPIFPLINAGAVRQGEGLWPNLAIPDLTLVLQRMRRHLFGGLICSTVRLPGRGSLAEGVLWCAGFAQWTGLTPDELLETWFQSRRPEEDFASAWKAAQRVRRIALELEEFYQRSLNSELGREDMERIRIAAQSLLAELDETKAEYGESDCVQNPAPLRDHVTYFVRDAKRILLSCLQRCHLSLPSMFSGTDTHESFWTSMAGNEGRGIGFGASSDLLESPNQGAQGTVMEAIYRQTLGN